LRTAALAALCRPGSPEGFAVEVLAGGSGGAVADAVATAAVIFAAAGVVAAVVVVADVVVIIVVVISAVSPMGLAEAAAGGDGGGQRGGLPGEGERGHALRESGRGDKAAGRLLMASIRPLNPLTISPRRALAVLVLLAWETLRWESEAPVRRLRALARRVEDSLACLAKAVERRSVTTSWAVVEVLICSTKAFSRSLAALFWKFSSFLHFQSKVPETRVADSAISPRATVASWIEVWSFFRSWF
jgi:hypothetical protein